MSRIDPNRTTLDTQVGVEPPGSSAKWAALSRDLEVLEKPDGEGPEELAVLFQVRFPPFSCRAECSGEEAELNQRQQAQAEDIGYQKLWSDMSKDLGLPGNPRGRGSETSTLVLQVLARSHSHSHRSRGPSAPFSE